MDDIAVRFMIGVAGLALWGGMAFWLGYRLGRQHANSRASLILKSMAKAYRHMGELG